VQDIPFPRYRPGVSKREPPGGDSASGLPRLPPGRHGLPRSFVVQNQRDRLTAGIISAVAEHGYHKTTISQIAGAAGVSRRTFYSYFSSKEECYLATYDVIASYLAEATRAAAASHHKWADRVRAQLAAGLEFFAANPDLVRFYLFAPTRAGEELAARYRLGATRVIAQLTDGMPADVHAPSPAVQNALAGGMAALIVRKVQKGEGERLAELLPDLTELVLTPYLGREAASRAAHPNP
jgi:AcrR family transcriptional regulator